MMKMTLQILKEMLWHNLKKKKSLSAEAFFEITLNLLWLVTPSHYDNVEIFLIVLLKCSTKIAHIFYNQNK